MIFGRVRERFPHITLSLRGLVGRMNVEFIVDTAFDGDLALPAHLASELKSSHAAVQRVRLADGYESNQPYLKIMLDWDEDTLPVEVLIMETSPLIGVLLLKNYLLQAEMKEGGEVMLEPL